MFIYCLLSVGLLINYAFERLFYIFFLCIYTILLVLFFSFLLFSGAMGILRWNMRISYPESWTYKNDLQLWQSLGYSVLVDLIFLGTAWVNILVVITGYAINVCFLYVFCVSKNLMNFYCCLHLSLSLTHTHTHVHSHEPTKGHPTS